LTKFNLCNNATINQEQPAWLSLTHRLYMLHKLQ